jgi:hypothetical protein
VSAEPIHQVPSRPDELLPATSSVHDASVLAAPTNPSARYVASEYMQKRNYNPIARMIDMVDRIETLCKADDVAFTEHFEKMLKVHTNLARYYAPQPKSIDIQIQSDATYTIQQVDYTSLFEERRHLIGPPANPGPPQGTPQLSGVSEMTNITLDITSDDD